jgi:hypothetical protein
MLLLIIAYRIMNGSVPALRSEQRVWPDSDCVTCGNAAFRHYVYASLGGVLIETDLYECATPGCPGPVAICEPIDG